MTNHEIIFRESCRLMEACVLTGSGQVAVITDDDGNERRVELPEAIHTFSAWKNAGYIVKKGEHAVAAFPVWKYSERRRQQQENDEDGSADGENAPAGKMYLRTAYFFKKSQVQEITA